MAESRLTPEEFGDKLACLGIGSSENILPIYDRSQIPDLPPRSFPGSWWIEHYNEMKTGDGGVHLEGDFVMEHERFGEVVGTTSTPISYSQRSVSSGTL